MDDHDSIHIEITRRTVIETGTSALLVTALEIQVRVVEEPYLARTHGDAYRSYAERTGRFVPGLGRGIES